MIISIEPIDSIVSIEPINSIKPIVSIGSIKPISSRPIGRVRFSGPLQADDKFCKNKVAVIKRAYFLTQRVYLCPQLEKIQINQVMSKTQAQPAFDTEAALAKAANMNIQELEDFVRKLNRVIFQKKSVDTTFRQRELLRLINQTVLPRENRALYLQLVQKLESDSITEAERAHFLRLTEEEETLRNERVKMLIELAHLKNIPLNQLMEEMGLQPVGHG